MEVRDQIQFRQQTREVLFSACLFAFERRLIGKYDPDLHNFSPGISTGLPHSALLLQMAQTHVSENQTPYGFTEFWSRHHQYFDLFRRFEPDLMDLARAMDVDFEAMLESPFFLDDVDEVQFEVEEAVREFVPEPDGHWTVVSSLPVNLDTIKPRLPMEFNILQMLLEVYGREKVVEILFRGFVLKMLDSKRAGVGIQVADYPENILYW